LPRPTVAVGETLVAGAPLGIAAQSNPQVTLELRNAANRSIRCASSDEIGG
jgi:hypothetical protein